MKLSTTLKTLPLVGVLALGLALAPTTSMADKGDRGHKDRYSHDGGKSFKGGKHDKRGHGYGHTKKGHDKHGHDRHSRHQLGHAYGHDIRGHRHGHSGHSHSTHVVHDYGHQHYLGLGNLRFMLGLHTDNIDIIFRD